MAFRIRFGIPEMQALYDTLVKKADADTIEPQELELLEKLTKTLKLLGHDPRHRSLNTHEIKALTDKFAKQFGFRHPVKVFESYMENHTPGARRLFWVYGPGKQEITVIALESHPDNKTAAYKAIVLAGYPSPRLLQWLKSTEVGEGAAR